MRRKTFFKRVTVGGAAVLGFLYPGLIKISHVEESTVQASAVAQPNTQPDLNFAGGKVVKKTSDGVVVDGGGTVRAIRISADTAVWKEFDLKPSEVEIQLDDYLDVRGTALPDNTLMAKQMWINIGRWDGIIDTISSTRLVSTNPKSTKSRSIELSSKLEIVKAQDGTPLPNHLSGLTPGNSIGAVGLRLPNGELRATRIWVW